MICSHVAKCAEKKQVCRLLSIGPKVGKEVKIIKAICANLSTESHVRYVYFKGKHHATASYDSDIEYLDKSGTYYFDVVNATEYDKQRENTLST